MIALQRAYEQLQADKAPGGGRARRRRRRRWVIASVSAVVGAVGVIAVVFAVQALQVRDDLLQAKAHVSAMLPAVKEGDTMALDATAAEVLQLTTHADGIVASPLWNVAREIPLVGENVVAVAEATKATHLLVRDAMPLALDIVAVMNPDTMMVDGGGIDLEPLRMAEGQLPELSDALRAASTHVESIDRSAILPLVDDNVGQLIDLVTQAAPLMDTVEKCLPAVLTLLGSEEERTYAVLFQNNAESRATGGNPGGGAVLSISDGRVTMRDDEDVQRFALAGPKAWFPQALENDAEAVLFEQDTTRYSQNFTRLPDYRDTAHLIDGLWTDVSGSALDGVISIDPVMLSYMLAVAGPVAIEGETEPITSENAVRVLLSETYERFGVDGPAADAYFAKVASAVFSKIMSGGWDPVAMLEQVQKGISEQRLYLWFAAEAEQQVAMDLGVDGAVTTANDDATQLGVFLNDASYSKLEYYLSTSVAVTCSAADRTVTTSITLRNAVPTAELSGYTLAWRNSSLGLPRTTMLFDVVSMALPGGRIIASSPEQGDLSGWDRAGQYKGRDTRSMLVTVPMGESRTVSFTSTLPDGLLGPLDVRYTPTVTQTPVQIDPSCGGILPSPRDDAPLLGGIQ